MPGSEHLALGRAIGQLRQCVDELRTGRGDTPNARRPANDVERLDIDTADLISPPTPPEQRDGRGGRPHVVVVPDRPYDPALWHGADDEGVGGVRRH